MILWLVGGSQQTVHNSIGMRDASVRSGGMWRQGNRSGMKLEVYGSLRIFKKLPKCVSERCKAMSLKTSWGSV